MGQGACDLQNFLKKRWRGATSEKSSTVAMLASGA
jgi:hypothetical protein